MRWIALVLLLTVAIGGCAGGNDDDDERTTNETSQSVATATTAEEPTEEPDDTEPTEAEEEPTPTEPEATNTPEPTATPDATATPEPTPTAAPTSTPTAPPAEADVQLGKWVLQPAPFGSTSYVSGDVLNIGAGAAQDVQVVVSLLDASGTILSSADASTVLPIIGPGGKSPFKAAFLETPADSVADVQFQVQFQTLDETSFTAEYYTTSFAITQVQWTADRITGQVQNVGDAPAQFVQIIVIGYTVEGEIFGVERTFSDLDQIGPGMTSPFTIDFLQYEGTPATVEAFASGSRVN